MQLKEMEDETAKLKAKMEETIAQDAAEYEVSAEEVDARSVFVGNVDYGCRPEDVQMHFANCGTIERVTIPTDNYGNTKGYAYVEFLEGEAIQEALKLHGSELHDRQIKVSRKRTNIPGFNEFQYDPYTSGYHFPTPYMPSPYMFAAPAPAPYRGGYGRAPRFRRSTRYRPY